MSEIESPAARRAERRATYKSPIDKKRIATAALATGAGVTALAGIVWGISKGSPAEAPTLHPTGAGEAAPFAQTSPAIAPLSKPTLPPSQYDVVPGKLTRTTVFYEGPNVHSRVVGLWPADSKKARNVGVVCVAVGEMVHMQADEIPTGHKTDSDRWYALDEQTLSGNEVQWVPSPMVTFDNPAVEVSSCPPIIGTK